MHPRDILTCRFGDQELCLLTAKATELMGMTKVLSTKAKLPVACTCSPSNICLDNVRLEYELQSVSKSTMLHGFLKSCKTQNKQAFCYLNWFLLMCEAMCQDAGEHTLFSFYYTNIIQ